MANYNAPTDPTRDKVDGQHWTTVRELWMRKDKEQCESWKDEVQNVLIFSGLFSAIVTAFLIESQQDLLLDPAQESVQLLRQIAAQSAGKNWVAEIQPGIDPISIWVNVFWFLSLVLSLTTALVGIVSLQWIRSHLQSLSKGADSLGLSYMHSRGLHQSYIPLVFTSLPVILIVSLAFFLTGLIMFLFGLSRSVAIPVTFTIACTFAFLVITTALPALQSLPVNRASGNQECFPSLYRSPQSSLFIRQTDWELQSERWLQHRTLDLVGGKGPYGHLESIREDKEPKRFAYDTIKALRSVQESRSAESEKEKTALAKCLAEVLPIHLDLFPTGDLADLVPFLPPSKHVPSAVFLQKDSATREDLSAVALLQIATCKGRPTQSAALVEACVRTTRWLFERPRTFESVPDSQPLDLVSKPHKLSPDVLEVLIGTLTHFFAFAGNFQPENQCINKTTHTSSYTYWFLVLSARILTSCSLSKEMKNRHAYILDVIAIQLGEGKARAYLFLTASIYASIISLSPTKHLSEDERVFLRAVKRYHVEFKDNLNLQQLCEVLRVGEVDWAAIDRAIEPADAGSVYDSSSTNNTITRGFCAHDRDSALGRVMESGGQSGDEVDSSGSGRNFEGKCHGENMEVVVHSPLL